MFQTRIADRKKLIHMALAVGLILLPASAARADILNYTFAGIASGTIDGTIPFNDAFTLSFTADSSAVLGDVPPDGFYRLFGLTGTFTEGAFSATLPGVIIVVNGNTSGGDFESVNFFNSTVDNGLGLQSNPALAGYQLATPVSTGTVTAAGDLEQTLNGIGDGFPTTGGDNVEFTGVSALSFTVTNTTTPEPSSILMLLSGLCGGAGMLRRRLLKA